MTKRRPQAAVNYDQAHRQVEPAPSVQRVPTDEVRQDADKELRLREQARARLAEMRGSDQSVLLFDSVEGPFNNPADVTPTQTVLTFTVPQGRVLVVNGVGWKFSDPFLQGSYGFEVELNVDDGAIPYWQDGVLSGAGQTGFRFPFGSMPYILDVEPIYVQSNSTLSVVLRRFVTSFVQFIAVAVIVRGWLEKPVGGI